MTSTSGRPVMKSVMHWRPDDDLTAETTRTLDTLIAEGTLDPAIATAAKCNTAELNWFTRAYAIDSDLCRLMDGLTRLAWAVVHESAVETAANAGSVLGAYSWAVTWQDGRNCTEFVWAINADLAVSWAAHTDKTGTPVPSVELALVNLDTGETIRAETWVGSEYELTTWAPEGLVEVLRAMAASAAAAHGSNHQRFVPGASTRTMRP